MQDPNENLIDLLAKLDGIEKRRSEAEQDLKSHQIETRVYRNGLGELTEDAQREITERLAIEERRLIREATDAFEEWIRTCHQLCRAVEDAAKRIIKSSEGHKADLNDCEIRLSDLRKREEQLNSILAV